jgi:hypothetical protein
MQMLLRLSLLTFFVMAGWSCTIAVEKEHRTISDSSERFVGVLRRGEAEVRKPTLTIFEVIGSGERLRKLHSVELLNPVAPRSMELSSDGRFLVTIDDDDRRVLGSRTLVIYDLVRNEHSAYTGSELLSEAMIRSLQELPNGGGYWKFGRGVFNKSNTQFYATEPKRLDERGVRNVVVDLPTRVPKVEEKPKTIPDDIVPIVDVKFHGHLFLATNSWTTSQEKVSSENNVFPVYLLRSWASDRPYETYTFDVTTQDYTRVANEKWPDPDPWKRIKDSAKSRSTSPFGL